MIIIKCITISVLASVLLLMNSTVAYAEEAPPKVIIRSSSEHPIAGTAWTLTLLVDHEDPNEVEALVPHFIGSLILDQVSKIPRLVNPFTGQAMPVSPIAAINDGLSVLERWTAMEYRFTLIGPGTVSFDEFTIITPRGQAKTEPFSISVGNQTAQQQGSAGIRNYRLVWEGAPLSLKIGENAVLSLSASGWNPALPLPESAFMPPVAPGYILESIPLSAAEKLSGFVIKLHLIPLDGNPFVLEGRRVSPYPDNGAVYIIPPLRIPVSIPAKPAQTAEQGGTAESGGNFTEEALPFPALEPALRSINSANAKRLKECEQIYHNLRLLWGGRRYAEALAVLRQKERDHPARAFFAVLRRDAEQVLGFAGTPNEKKRIFRMPGRSRLAVAMDTVVRRIPDISGEEIVSLRQGKTVRLSTKRIKQNQTWVWVRTDEYSGWVPAVKIILY